MFITNFLKTLPGAQTGRVFLILCLAQITISFNLAAVAAVIPSISRELGFSDVEVARIIPYYLWSYGLGALLYAPLTRWFSVKHLLTASMIVFGATSLYCGLTRSLDGLLWANLINGCAAASVVPLGLLTIGKMVPQDLRGRAVGVFFTSSFISSLLGVVASGAIHWSFLFIIPAILAIITIINILINRVDDIARPEGRRIDYVKTMANGNVLRIFTVIFLMSLLYHGVYKWYGVYLDREYGLSQSAISSLILVTSFTGAFGQNVGGMLTDLKGRLFSVELGLIVLGFATMALTAHQAIVGVAIVLAFISMGWTVCHNGISTVLTDFPDEFRSELASLNSAIRFLSGGLGFYLSGFLIEVSFSFNFFMIGLWMVLLVPVTQMLLGNTKHRGARDL